MLKKMNFVGFFAVFAAAVVLSGCASTPMGEAVDRGDSAEIERLLTGGMDIDARLKHHARSLNGADEHTLLTYYARWGNKGMVSWLLGKGADVNAAAPRVRVNGRTLRMSYSPLIWACLYGHTEVADVLLKSGADTKHRGRIVDYDGTRWNELNILDAIEAARIKGHEDIVNLIIAEEKRRIAPKLKVLSLPELIEKSSLNNEAYVLALTDALVEAQEQKLPDFIVRASFDEKAALLTTVKKRLGQALIEYEQCKNEAEIYLGQDNGVKAVERRNLSVAIMSYQAALKSIKAELAEE